MKPNSLSPKALKQRLEALPDRRDAATQGDRFVRFQVQTAASRNAVSQAAAAAEIASQVLDDQGYREVQARVRRTARRAATLSTKLLGDVTAVTADQTGTDFAGLSEMASGALDLCKSIWKRTIEAKLRGRVVLVDKLPAHVLGDVGDVLRKTITALQRESACLPATSADSARVRQLLADFDGYVQRLQLQGPVGAFLQSLATDSGASLELIRDEAVSSFLDQHHLWGAFSVKLP